MAILGCSEYQRQKGTWADSMRVCLLAHCDLPPVPEVELWVAVIVARTRYAARHVLTEQGYHPPPASGSERRDMYEAHEFVTTTEMDDLCDLICLDPEATRRTVRQALRWLTKSYIAQCDGPPEAMTA